MRIPISIATALMLVMPATASELNAYLVTGTNPLGATLIYSECAADELNECESYDLRCEANAWSKFEVFDGPIEQIAVQLIKAPEARPKGVLSFGDGTKEDLDIWSVQVQANELDGGWSLEVAIPANAFDRLSANNSEGVKLKLGGQSFNLTPMNGDGRKLVQFKDACK